MYEILYIYWHLLHGSTFNLCNRVTCPSHHNSTLVANRINGYQDKYSSISASHSASGSPRSFNSTCALATRLRFTKPRFHSPTPLFETLKQNRQHITQSS